MQPAEKTHYRKGLALGLTMAEIFSVIVFILLLLCGILLQRQGDELDDVKADLSIAKSFVERQDPLSLNEINWLDAYRTLQDSLNRKQQRVRALRSDNLRLEAENESLRNSLESAEFRSQLPERVASYKGQLEVLSDSLEQTLNTLRKAEQRNNELEDQLSNSNTLYMAALSELENMSHFGSPHISEQLQQTIRVDSLEEALDQTRDIIADFYTRETFKDSLKNISIEDSLKTIAMQERRRSQAYRNQVTQATREREEAVSRAALREEQLSELMGGRGIDPPPCWLSGENKPEHILRIELTNNGFQIFKIAPRHRIDDPVVSHLTTIQEGHEYTPSEFLNKTRPIYDEGRSRTISSGPSGCRFWILPVDKTGSIKEVFRLREADLGRHFWYRW